MSIAQKNKKRKSIPKKITEQVIWQTTRHERGRVCAIDASRAFVHERTGIEEYAYQVVKHMREPLADKHVVLYLRFHGVAAVDARRWIEEHFFDLPQAWEVRVVPWRRLWTQCGLALAMWRDRPDVLFVPAHTVPWIHPRETVVVVHGLEYEMTPQAYSAWARLYMRTSIKASCRWAAWIITVSENTKRDVARLYGTDMNKMMVVYEGVNAQSDVINSEKKENDVPYFFFVGRLEERKNIARVVSAFDIFKEKTGLPYKLILAGGRGYGYAQIAQAIADARYGFDIVQKGFVSDKEKWRLMRGAQVFVFPTLYEGFGLPVLEAQQCGIPVVTSDISSLPEVVGVGAQASAVTVIPTDVQMIADALERLATDDVHRRDIIMRGYENIKRFSWRKCAQEIVDVLMGDKK